MKRAIYPGTFDPFTYGHLDILHRAIEIFDEVIVAVAKDTSKYPLFTMSERLKMIKEATRNIPNVKVENFKGLLIKYALNKNAIAIIRGLRAISDFEYEFQMALMNRKLTNKVTTLFLMPDEQYTYLSATMVREIASLGGDCSHFVPPAILKHLTKKYQQKV